MPERLKDRFFTEESLRSFAAVMRRHHSTFDEARFLELVDTDAFRAMGLMDMSRYATQCLAKSLPEPYQDAVEVLMCAAPDAKGMESFCLPTYVELFGLDDWETSLPAMVCFTKYSSSEFAIRPFIHKDSGRAMAFLERLAGDEDPKVRRFASEGCRPRLPWAMALPVFKKDPSPVLVILEKLKHDPSEFVRTSVANNLNDISKDHPGVVLGVCERWLGSSAETDWIVKRACRTMLKAGDKRALMLFGFGDPGLLEVTGLRLRESAVAIRQDTRFTFTLHVGTTDPCKVRLEYAVYYVKASGRSSKKVFQLREATLAPGDHKMSRKVSFADQSTRKYYPGTHRITVVVNGVEKAHVDLELRPV